MSTTTKEPSCPEGDSAAMEEQSLQPRTTWRYSGSAALFGMALFPVAGMAQTPPSWWSDRGAVNGSALDNDAVVNQGQLKHFARKAADELNAKVPGGAGTDINNLVQGWIATHPDADDWHAVTVGQLKWVADKLYTRLQYARWCDANPAWVATGTSTNGQLANLGQLRTLFNFDLTAPAGQLPAWWQKFHFGSTGISPSADADGDGISNLNEYLNGTTPNGSGGPGADNDGDGWLDVNEVTGGGNQQFLDNPALQLHVEIYSR